MLKQVTSVGLLNLLHGIFYNYADVTMQETKRGAERWNKLSAAEKKQYNDRAKALKPRKPEDARKRRTGGLVMLI